MAQFALVPYLTPFPRNENAQVASLQPSNTLQTLFRGFDSTVVSDEELEPMLRTMDQTLFKCWSFNSTGWSLG
jgi:hypothetical protein